MFEISKDKIKKRIKKGSIVILKNAKRNIKGVMVGESLRVKVNANVGTSTDKFNLSEELKKAKVAISYGADTIMDLSIAGNLNEIRRNFLRKINVPIGTVPIYQAFIEKKTEMSKQSILKIIEQHCRDGVDFMTLHCGITKEILDKIHERLIPVTSRGGSFLVAWMLENKTENPLFENFSDILGIVKEYDVTISLGDALRPACLNDATDYLQLKELITISRLIKIARREKVKVIVEGPGHLPLNEIEFNVKLAKKICDNSPLYVLGPITTDISLGYDHISGAIGGAVAGMYGADFLCYVTPSEHLGLPTIEDVKQGVIAAKIAAHSADITKIRDFSIDDEISKARKELNWKKIFSLSIDKNIKNKYSNLDKKSCSMCGIYCALKIINEYIKLKKN